MRDSKQRRRPGRRQPESRRQVNTGERPGTAWRTSTGKHTELDRRTGYGPSRPAEPVRRAGHDSNRQSVQRRSPDPAQRADIRREAPRQAGVRQVVPGKPELKRQETVQPREKQPEPQARRGRTSPKKDTRERTRRTPRSVSRRGEHNSNLRQYIFVIRELTSREVKRKYARSSLGIIWSVLNPLLTMIVMSLIFSTMFRRSIENFPVYYLTGQIFWTLFSTATDSTMSSLVDNRNLLIKAKLPKQTFILSRIYTALVNFGYTCIAYVLMLVVFRVQPHWTMALFFVDVALALVFSMGIGYILAVAYVFFADIRYLYSVFLTLLMYLSAIFYPVDMLPDAMQTVIGCNPVYLLIFFARECVMYGRVPSGDVWLKLAVWCGGSFLAGMIVFLKKENQVMQKI